MTDSHEGSIKGGVLVSRLAFVRARAGEPGIERVLSALPAADREVLSGILLASAWYPFALNERLDQAIRAEMGIGDKIFKVLGEESAAHGLGGPLRRYVRDHDPHGLLRHTASIYRLHYDTGSRTYEMSAEKRAVIRTLDSKTFSRADCLTIVGWHERAIAMCGGIEPRVTEAKCRARGDAVCEYVCEWR